MSGADMGAIAAAAIRKAGLGGTTPEAERRLGLYLGEVYGWSERVHLVGKGRLEKSIELLAFDSLALLGAVEGAGIAAEKVADIGSGAGFPGLVWKIVRPGLAMTLFERRLKPQTFLERMVAHLGLEGIVVAGEDAARGRDAGTFELVISKAAGRLDAILPIADKLLGAGGAYATIKGESWKREIPAFGKTEMRFELSIELAGKRGTVLIFRKISPA